MQTLRFRADALAIFAALTLSCASPAQWAGEWWLDESSGTNALDISGNANDGTLFNFTGNPWVPAQYGNGLMFDGVDDYVEITASPQFPIYRGVGAPFSVAFWIKAPEQNDRRAYSEGRSSGGNPLFTIGSPQFGSQDRLRVFMRNDAVQVVCDVHSIGTVYDDTWHHVAFVNASGQMSIYIDGVLDSNPSYNPGMEPGTPGYGTFTFDRISLGAVLRGSTCCHMNGILDDVRVYQFALSDADVGMVMAGVGLLPTRSSISEYGVGCGPGPLDLAGSGTAALGGAGIQLQVQNGTPMGLGFMLLGIGPVNPIDISLAGFPGCSVYPNDSVSFSIGQLDATGSTTVPLIPIPNNPTLTFVQVNFQAAAITSSLELSDVVIALLGG